MIPPRGRGAVTNPDCRFSALRYEADPDAVLAGADDDQETGADRSSGPATQFLTDHAQTILAHNDSPDVGFDTSLNPYRGCEHGCIYCYARPTHEYLGYSAGQDFESRILVKEEAPELLRRELAAPSWQPRVIALSGVTDCYQPVERRLGLTRACLAVLADCRNPVIIITKNHTVTRDADLLAELARHQAAAVYVSITTLDAELVRKMEPRASPPSRRLAAIAELRAAGVPAGVLVAPVIPGLTDHEGPAILEAAAQAGALYAGWTMLRLPFGVASLFEEWLAVHAPLRKDKVLSYVRQMRGGKLNDPSFGSRMKGQGALAEQTSALLRVAAKRCGLAIRGQTLSVASFRRPENGQMRLFG